MNKTHYPTSPDRIDLEKEFHKCQTRSKLHTQANMTWLNKRQNKENPQAKEMYRYLPEERMRHIELTLLFEKFDKDGSKALDFIEVFRMFQKYGIFLSKDELVAFFKVVDLNKDFSLNLEEFKACYLDPEAKSIFAQIMKRLHSRTNQNEESVQAALNEMNNLQSNQGNALNPSPMLPSSFQGVISLLTYLSHRDEIKEQLHSKGLTMKEQYSSLKQLVELTNKIDNIQKVNFQKKVKVKQSDQDRQAHLRWQLNKLKREATRQGMEQAEEELRKKCSAHLITVVPEKIYKYHYQGLRPKQEQQSGRKFKLLTNHRTTHSDQRVNKFFKYMNFNVPDSLKKMDQQIWNQMFTNNQQLDVILERNRKNQIESQRTDRLRTKIKETLDNLQDTLEEKFETRLLQKQKVEIPQYDDQYSQHLPTLTATTNRFSDQKWYPRYTFIDKDG